MPHLRIRTAADLLGVSDDTVRRWVDQGRVELIEDHSGRRALDGASVARLAQELAAEKSVDAIDDGVGRRSARNHLTGIVTGIVSDQVMSQVELQCGAYRVVSLISTEAVRELGLEVGSLATAVVKATNVTIEGTAA
ncbi:MAG: TOBE domain-containing protein [Actinomycetaceae bacterium]